MTCVVAIKDGNKIWMGADDMITTGSDYYMLGYNKIIKRNNMLIGLAGNLHIMQLIQCGFFPKLQQTDKQNDLEYLVMTLAQELRKMLEKFKAFDKDKEDDETPSVEMLIAYRGKIYKITDDLCVLEAEQNFQAIGTGHAIAMGSLLTTKGMPEIDPEKKLRLALKTAASYILGVGPSVKIKTITF